MTGRIALLVAVSLLMAGCGGMKLDAGGDLAVSIPAGIDHGEYDRLLKRYVDERGLVAYAEWHRNADDRAALDDYLRQYAPAPERKAEGDEFSAALINLYNAAAMKLILDHYPLKSIMMRPHPFDGRRHLAGGRRVSLDDIEHATLLPHFGYRTHAVLVCVARSCPPLRREAYVAAKLDAQADLAFRTWLSRDDLNRFHPESNKIAISSVFDWFRADFEKAGGIQKVLARHGPSEHRDFLAAGGYRIEHIPYNWALNDQKDPGRIGPVRRGWERVKDWFR